MGYHTNGTLEVSHQDATLHALFKSITWIVNARMGQLAGGSASTALQGVSFDRCDAVLSGDERVYLSCRGRVGHESRGVLFLSDRKHSGYP
jgi:hypothetical protein